MNKKIEYWDWNGNKHVHVLGYPNIGGGIRGEWVVSDVQQEGLIIRREWKDRPYSKKRRIDQDKWLKQCVNGCL